MEKGSEVFENDRRRRSVFWKPLWKWLVSNLVSSPWSPFKHLTDICTLMHVHIHARPAWSNSNTSHTFFDPSRPQYGLERHPLGARHKKHISKDFLSRLEAWEHTSVHDLSEDVAQVFPRNLHRCGALHTSYTSYSSIAVAGSWFFPHQHSLNSSMNTSQHPLSWSESAWTIIIIAYRLYDLKIAFDSRRFWRLQVVVEHRSRVAQIAGGKGVFPATTVDTRRILTDANHPTLTGIAGLCWTDWTLWKSHDLCYAHPEFVTHVAICFCSRGNWGWGNSWQFPMFSCCSCGDSNWGTGML